MATITWAHHSLIGRERKGSLLGSLFTVLLAVLFTVLQVVEYNQSSFTISDGVFGSVFFFGTGFSNAMFFLAAQLIIILFLVSHFRTLVL